MLPDREPAFSSRQLILTPTLPDKTLPTLGPAANRPHPGPASSLAPLHACAAPLVSAHGTALLRDPHGLRTPRQPFR